MEAAAKPRPPKLGPRKTSTPIGSSSPSPAKRQASSTVTAKVNGHANVNDKANGSAGNGHPKPPKLGPRKSSSQVPSMAKKDDTAISKVISQGVAAQNASRSRSDLSKTQSVASQGEAKPSKEAQKPSVPSSLERTKSTPPKGLPKLGPRPSKSSGQQQNSSPQDQSAASKDQRPRGSEREESLTTILNPRQRTQLIILLAAATATMRDNLTDVFEAMTASSPGLRRSTDMTEDEKIMNPDIDPGTADVAAHDKERKALAKREKEVSTVQIKQLRTAAEDWFDTWRETIIGRVGEVLNSAKEAKGEIKTDETQDVKPTTKTPAERKIDPGSKDAEGESGSSGDVEQVLKELYPPVKTSLAKLDYEKRVLVLHSVLLLILSTKHYASMSRVLLLFLMSSLNLSLETLKKDEDKTAHGLLESAKELSGTLEARKKVEVNTQARKWKVGLASVAGAAIIGVTGGMAAPMVAAGVGSVMGGLGLGATTAASYLGSIAGSSMLVGSLFGAYGGRMTGQMMDNYAKEVSDFAFLPVHPHKKHLLQSKGKGGGEEAESEAGKQDPEGRRLRVTIGISGWLTEKEEVAKPWTVLNDGTEAFALRWELKALLNLGNAMTELINSAAWGYAQKQLIARTIFADLAGAMWPIALIKAARVVDNPFSLAKSRAEKAGVVLADALINHAQGERPVNLVGYSLGARVIYSCLMSLADRRAFGLIENVVLIGAPVPSKSADWRKMRAVVAGRLVNVFSDNDYILGFLYRTSSAQYEVAGLEGIQGVAGVENVDVSQTVSGHLRYRFMVGNILKKIGFEDLDLKEVEREEEALKKLDEEEQKRMEELKKKIPSRGAKQQEDEDMSEADAEKEADEMQKNVEQRTESSMMQRGAELLHLTGRGWDVDASKASSTALLAAAYLSHVAPKWSSKKTEKDSQERTSAATAEVPSNSSQVPTQDAGGKSYLTKASEKLSRGKAATSSKPVKEEGGPEEPESSEKTEGASSAENASPAESSKKSYMRRAADAMPSWQRKPADT